MRHNKAFERLSVREMRHTLECQFLALRVIGNIIHLHEDNKYLGRGIPPDAASTIKTSKQLAHVKRLPRRRHARNKLWRSLEERVRIPLRSVLGVANRATRECAAKPA